MSAVHACIYVRAHLGLRNLAMGFVGMVRAMAAELCAMGLHFRRRMGSIMLEKQREYATDKGEGHASVSGDQYAADTGKISRAKNVQEHENRGASARKNVPRDLPISSEDLYHQKPPQSITIQQ